jgi:hypothetical protein
MGAGRVPVLKDWPICPAAPGKAAVAASAAGDSERLGMRCFGTRFLRQARRLDATAQGTIFEAAPGPNNRDRQVKRAPASAQSPPSLCPASPLCHPGRAPDLPISQESQLHPPHT